MPRQLVECVPNFSEGRDMAKVDAIVQTILAVPDVVLLDRESDTDHNRSVLTFVGPPNAVADAAFRAVEKAVATIDLTQHTGAHESGEHPQGTIRGAGEGDGHGAGPRSRYRRPGVPSHRGGDRHWRA